MKNTTVFATLLAVLATVSPVSAQDLEPRAYVNTPVGMNFLIAGYAYTDGGVATDPAVPLDNAKVRSNSAFLAYARALDLWGTSGKIDVVVPYARLSGHADFMGQPGQRTVEGFGDPRFRLSANFYGAPALSAEQFPRYEQDLIVGGSIQVMVPLGRYDKEKLLNIGTNRWGIRPEVGVSKALGPLTLEVTADMTFYTDNDEFLGGKKLEQDPFYNIQGHLVYRLRSGIWVALDGNYYAGGRTTTNGVRRNNLQQNSRAGMTVALPLGKHNSVKLFASTNVSTRTDNGFDLLGIAWQYRWGGGL